MHRKKIKGINLSLILASSEWHCQENLSKEKKRTGAKGFNRCTCSTILCFSSSVCFFFLFHFYQGFIATRQTVMSLSSTRPKEKKRKRNGERKKKKKGFCRFTPASTRLKRPKDRSRSQLERFARICRFAFESEAFRTDCQPHFDNNHYRSRT